jgi:transposase
MNKISYKFLIILTSVLIGCINRANQEDRELIKKLESDYYGKYEFKLHYELYFDVIMKDRFINDEDEIKNIFKTFFLLENGGERKTDFFYLNLYDNKRKFLYQLYYDRDSKEIEKGYAEAY